MQAKSKKILDDSQTVLSNLLHEIEKISGTPPSKEIHSSETVLLKKIQVQLEQMQTFQQELHGTNQKLLAKIRELDSLTHYLISILCNISQGLLFIDLNGNVTTYNAAIEQILEVQPHLVLFKQFWKNFDDSLFGFSIREALEKKHSPETHYTNFVSPSGKQYDLEIHTTFILQDTQNPGYSEQDSMQGIIILVRDVTEIRRLQLIAKRNSRMKVLGEMAASVAHEIRNPLGGIKGFASLLERDLSDKPELQKMAGYIVQGTDNLNRLVTQVLNYSRPLQPQFASMDLVQLLEELRLHMLVDPSVKERIDINLETDLPELWIHADMQILRSAILNLMVNAVQAMPNHGTLTLKLIQQEELAIIQVKDTGIGIPSENLEKIFSPFFTTRPEGNGFGLAEVYKAVEIHGGDIEVHSIVQKGTEFSLKLPVKAYK
ncbi:signal transduction histidine-protein kinase AtoS [Parachlamydia acanthamoebae UV-7]|jgi:signal transduction histidine kinase|uniref:histidine kinase n=2 Tax=Parachlamydia acanthamoebae TaxID=83552 RepID=F8KYW7_PARAV|nr:ATP-binding protein [Parachlamydia acanthamoebae]CCB86085.1 signal transduction histidine-protein kinase AtoS [Parachlamydia acanthamoebae UV-7]